jgi:DNA-binding transcriptional MerR regulator
MAMESLEVGFKSMPEILDIGEVAQRSGMTPSTLRFYELQGLIESVERKGLRRQYRPNALQTLAVVAICREAGFSLTEIKALLSTRGGRGWKALVEQKRDELRSRARHLTTVATQLDHALGCPSPNVFDCVHFQTALARALPVGEHDGARSVGAPVPRSVRAVRSSP